MKNTIFSRVYFSLSAILIVFSILLFFITQKLIIMQQKNDVENRLETLAKAVSIPINGYLDNQNFYALDEYLQSLSSDIPEKIAIVNYDGKDYREDNVLASSEDEPNAKAIGFINAANDYVYFLPLKTHLPGKYFLMIDVSKEYFQPFYEKLRSKIITLSLVVLFALLLIAYWFSRSLTKPIKSLANSAKEISLGNYDVYIYPEKTEELTQLALSFRQMLINTKDLVAELTKQKETFFKIITSIKEPLFVTNSNGHILLFNNSFEATYPNSLGKYYWEIITEKNLTDYIKSSLAKRFDDTQELEIKKQTYICSYSYIESSEQHVFILYDISDMKNMDKLKREFISNASHELKTPLTSIKGFVETMKENCDEEHGYYLNIISRNTERLIGIVNDLLALSALENAPSLDIQAVNFKKLVDSVAVIFQQRLKEKNIALYLNIPHDILLEADPYKLEQVLVNLLDNAIKYSDKGSITVKAEVKAKYLHFYVEDSGLGIPEAQIPYIFKRFYVVDKSRARKSGGTGLGLSIVKNIVLLHKGGIDVETKEGQYTRFVVKLPLKYDYGLR